MTSGYSKTPLAKKLGLKTGFKMYLHNAPDYYMDLFDEIPTDLTILAGLNKNKIDFIHGFFTSETDLRETVKTLKIHIKSNGIIWISWPKGKSKIKTDINREIVRTIVLNEGLVDTKVCAVDEDWSGLKFVYRLVDRK